MAISYVDTAWNSNGTNASANTEFKDLVIAGCQAGDLLVVFAVAEQYQFPAGTRSIVTQDGATSAWTTVTPAVTLADDVDFIAAFATVSATGSVTVRGSMRTVSQRMGVGAFLIPAAEVGAAYGFVGTGFVADVDGLVSVTLSVGSTVLYMAGDWSALSMGTATTPGGGTVHRSYFDTTNYSSWATSWTAQAAGTRNYGPPGLSGHDISGALFRMDTGGGAVSRTPADPVGVTDSVSVDLSAGNQDYVIDIDDLVDITDTGQDQRIDYGMVLEDAASVTDLAVSTLARTLSIDDAVGVTDQATSPLGRTLTFSDGVDITDVADVAIEGDYTREPADPVSIADDVSIEFARMLISDDEISATDEISLQRTFGRGEEDLVGIQDAVTVYLERDDEELIADGVGITDVAATELSSVTLVGDLVELTDAVTVVLQRVVTVADFLQVTDVVVDARNKRLELDDAVAIADDWTFDDGSDACWPPRVGVSAWRPRYAVDAGRPRYAVEAERSC